MISFILLINSHKEKRIKFLIVLNQVDRDHFVVAFSFDILDLNVSLIVVLIDEVGLVSLFENVL
jgi:hypothetical protein